ncbi:MAG: tripartite tricarboxylate transporter substrate-binding protein, partial [Micromonosporaceae bacterium]
MIMKRHRRAGRAGALLSAALLAVAGCAGGGATTTTGEGGGASLKGETIHFVVSYGPGGGYDIIARAIAPYLEKELDATVVVENEDGAGGLVAANQVYTAEPDGTTIGFYSGQGMAGAALGGADGARFSIPKYSFIGRLGNEPRVLTVGKKSG